VNDIDWSEVRAGFAALSDKTFLDAACVSVAPKRATDALARFAELTATCPFRSATEAHIAMDEARAAVRPLAARMLGAKPEEIAIVESTTEGLSTLARALDWRDGDRVALSSLEFLQVAMPWAQLEGVGLDPIAHEGGTFSVDDVARAIGPRTRMVAISSVQWSHGFRCDLDAIASLCRERGVWLVVDAVQQLGAFPIDVSRTPVDVVIAGGHKWLNSPFGAGVMYVRGERLAELKMPIGGYLSLEPPAGGWGTYFQTPSITPFREYRLVDEARALETGGTANYPGAVALAASMELVLELGQDRIASRIEGLASRAIEGLQASGARVVTPTDPARRAGIVTFDLGSPAANEACMNALLDASVLVSVRYTDHVGGVRVSCHYFDDESDVDRLLDVVAAHRGG